MLWDGKTGLVAALFLSMCSFHIWYSREARMYALLTFSTTLFLYAVLHATRHANPTTKEPGRGPDVYSLTPVDTHCCDRH